jgi:hypothetical protein
VNRIWNEYGCRPTPPAAASASREHVNVVFYLIESFMDPRDLRLDFTSDPIPAFREAGRHGTAGYVIVPRECCGSTSTEFEVLTGMSCSFLPEGACPYVQYVKRDLPSLVRFFKKHGYATATAHAGPPCLYNRVPVYQHFEVGEALWLTERIGQGGVALDIALRNPSDEALVDAVIEYSKKHRRYFMYASANSTHSPYNYDNYLTSDLDVRDAMSATARNELKTYLNAVRTADQAVGKLLKYFAGVSQKTIVVVLGDHWPPFANSAEIYAKSEYAAGLEAPLLPTKRRVPLLIWTNFSGKTQDITCSTNFLGAEVLSRIGLQPTGLFAITDALRADVKVISNHCLRAGEGDSPCPQSQRMLADYWLLQYDLLLGKQFARQDDEPAHRAVDRAQVERKQAKDQQNQERGHGSPYGPAGEHG